MTDKSRQAVSVYDKVAGMYYNEYGISDFIDDFLGMVKENGRILDVGCGPGRDSVHMASRGFIVTGIDLSKEMIRIAKQNFPDVEFRVMDMREPLFKPGSFDGVFVAFSLIHLPKRDVLKTLKKLYRLLKKGGTIYIAVQEGECGEMFHAEPLKPDESIFLNIFSAGEAESLVKEAGFSIIAEHKRRPAEKEFQFNKLFILARKQ